MLFKFGDVLYRIRLALTQTCDLVRLTNDIVGQMYVVVNRTSYDIVRLTLY
jgi:hypothetical protein